MWWIPVVWVILIFILTASVLHRYGNLRRLEWYVILIVFMTWWVNFSVIVVTPVDVSSTFYRHCLNTTEPSVVPNISTVDSHAVATLPRTRRVDPIGPSSTEADTSAIVPNPNATTPFVVVTQSKNTGTDNGTDNGTDVSAEPVAVPEPIPVPVPASKVTATCDKPMTYVSPYALRIVWNFVYWFAQFMTWGVIPLFQSYSDAGDFTFGNKMRTAIKENVMFYGTFGIIFGVFFVYIAIRESLTMKNLVGIGMAASNTWGLTATVSLLGYGLVDVPRRWWERCQTEKWMEILYFGVAKATQELDEVNEDLENATKEIHVIKEMVDESHEMYDRVQLIAYKAPLYDAAAQRRGRRNLPVIRSSDIDEKMLVKLHRTIIRTVHLKERCQAIYDTLMDRAMVHEDIMHGRYRVHFNESDGFMDKAYKRIVYLWQTQGYRVFAALMTVTTAVLSLIVVLSEALGFIRSPILSPSAMLMHAFGLNYYYMAVEIICITTIVHMAVCTYNTLFRIRLFNYFHLTPNHHSDGTSLLFSALCVSRLTPALIFNFLSINQLDGNSNSLMSEETAFTQIMGHMDIVPFIANGFMIFFPVVVVLFALAAFFRVFNRFFYDEDLTTDLIEEGLSVVRVERRRINRHDPNAQRERRTSSSTDAVERMRSQRLELRRRTDDMDVERERRDELESEQNTILGRVSSLFRGSGGGSTDTQLTSQMALLAHDDDEETDVDMIAGHFDDAPVGLPRVASSGRAEHIFDDV